MKLIQSDSDKEDKFMYRCVDGWNCQYISIDKYEIVRETPCGFWIRPSPWYDWYGDKKYPKWTPKSKNGKNHFAWETEEQALENYYHRKKTHVSILRQKLRNIERLLKLAEIETGRKM